MYTFKNIFLTVAMATILTGCISAGGGVNGVQTNRIVYEGCGYGALTGAIAGAIAGRKDKSGKRNRKIFGGALIGGAVGCTIGYNVAKRTEQYASAGNAIDSEIARNEQNAKELHEYNNKLAGNIEQYKKDIRAIKTAKISAKDKHNQLVGMRNTVNKQYIKSKQTLNSVDQEITISTQQLHKYKKQAKNQDAQRWERKIIALKKERAVLARYVSSVGSLRSTATG